MRRRSALMTAVYEESRKRRAAMGRNVGSVDRILRVIVGAVLIALVFVGPQTAWGWIGLIPIATALIGWCPAYRLLGIQTCSVAKSS
jgi:hypothetical protein